jgi:hypothetical protein
MPKSFNWWLAKLQRTTGPIILILTFFFFLSGYGIERQIIDLSLAKLLHEKILPPLFVFFLLLHILFWLKKIFLKFIEDEKWVNLYVIILAGVLFLLFLIYHF